MDNPYQPPREKNGPASAGDSAAGTIALFLVGIPVVLLSLAVSLCCMLWISAKSIWRTVSFRGQAP